jgi:transcriptional regulator with XRE-family HTH domain
MKGKKNKRNDEAIMLAGSNIRKFRKALNLSQTELAFKAETDYTQISNMERGITDSSLSQYVNVARALGVTVGMLLGE